jgi:arabinofuranan 3-O-arabinosyltransferase
VVAGTGGPPVPRPAARAVTDGARRADTAFGLISGNVSETYTATQVNPPDDQLGDPGGPPRQLAPVPARLQTVAVLSGAAGVTASSVGSWVTEAPQYDPVNAFDRNAATAWAAGVPRAAGQWLQVSFGRRRVLPASAGIRLLTDLAARPVPSRVTVSTAAGRVSTVLRRTGAVQRLAVPPGATRWLRVTIAATTRPTIQGISAGLGAGISEVLVPGVQVRRLLRPAPDPAGRSAPAQVLSFAQQLPSPALLASPAAYPPLARAFRTAGPAPLQLTATAMALPGHALTALLQRLTPPGRGQVQVTATSTLGSLPSLAPAQLLARPSGTGSAAARPAGQALADPAPGPWIAASAHPVLNLSWTGDRRIADLTLAPDPGVGAFPQRVTITSPAGARTAAVGFGGLVTLSPPLVTDQLSISFPASEPASAAAAAQRGRLPIALGRLTIPALAGLHAAVPDPAAPFRLPCGQGPALTIDDRTYPTAVAGQVSDLSTFRPVQVRLCAPQPASVLTLPPGAHQLIAAAPNPFALTSLALTSATGVAASRGDRPAAAGRALQVISWQADRRSLRVAAGPASYLELHQNANPGWVATLNGRRLAPATLDGWQQGYVLPAGRGGVITLAYAPDGLYHWLLAVAALGVLLLLAAAWPRPRRPARRPAGSPIPAGTSPDSDAEPAPRSEPDLGASTAPGFGPFQEAGLTSGPGPVRRVSPPPAGPAAWAGLAAVAVLIFAAGGPVAAVVPVLAALAWWRPRWLPAVAAAAIAAAGVIAATAARPDALGSGAFSGAAQACALTALAAALLPALRRPPPPGPAKPRAPR